jgi:2-polyprenyl-6-methoxyphenol hydroxylase-like FAD-dependent oxidoreductase
MEDRHQMADGAVIERDCVIAGGGPAGMVLGYALARAGVRVTVLEKHADFLRDFRGDTIHPSTITTLGELGLRDEFLRLPLNRLTTMDVVFDGQRMTMVDFRRLPAPDNFLVMAPQWDLLNFLAAESQKLPGYELRMVTEATGLLIEDGQVRGVYATGPDGELTLRAPLTVAADGRTSVLRAAAGLVPEEFGVPIDVLWFNIPKPSASIPDTLGYLTSDGGVITIPRGDYYQAGILIKKGGLDDLRAAGLEALRKKITDIAPVLAPVTGTITSWDQIKLLSVQINRLERWYRPGFIAIGDAAHAMSPVGGVGVNYAIQDAVALANLTAKDLAYGFAPIENLQALQKRREKPVKKMQAIQRVAHRFMARGASGGIAPTGAFRLISGFTPLIRGVAARFIGIGFLPEHVNPSILRPAPTTEGDPS